MYYINMFFFYSILGNIFERIVVLFKKSSYVSGFMGTIFTPVYGIAALLIVMINKKIKIKIKNKFLSVIFKFFLFGILLTIIEFIGGHLIELVFHKVYWNYEPLKYNFGKYISLECSCLWALMSLLIIYLIDPLFKKIEKYIPKFLTILLIIFFILNLLYVFIVKIT